MENTKSESQASRSYRDLWLREISEIEADDESFALFLPVEDLINQIIDLQLALSSILKEGQKGLKRNSSLIFRDDLPQDALGNTVSIRKRTPSPLFKSRAFALFLERITEALIFLKRYPQVSYKEILAEIFPEIQFVDQHGPKKSYRPKNGQKSRKETFYYFREYKKKKRN